MPLNTSVSTWTLSQREKYLREVKAYYFENPNTPLPAGFQEKYDEAMDDFWDTRREDDGDRRPDRMVMLADHVWNSKNSDPTAKFVMANLPDLGLTVGQEMRDVHYHGPTSFLGKLGQAIGMAGMALAGAHAAAGLYGAATAGAAASSGGVTAAAASPVASAAPIDAALATATGTPIGTSTAAGLAPLHSAVVAPIDAALSTATGTAVGSAAGHVVTKAGTSLVNPENINRLLKAADTGLDIYDKVTANRNNRGIINQASNPKPETPKNYSVEGLHTNVGPSGNELKDNAGNPIYTPRGLINRAAVNYV